jgi:hypothetical protein
MGTKINIVNTSGKRLPKKPGLNQTNLTSDGQSLSIQSTLFDGNVGGGGSSISLPIPNKLNNNTSEPLVLNLRAIGAGVFVDNTTVTIINNCVFDNTSLTNIELTALSTVGGDNYIQKHAALTNISQPLLSTVGGDNFIESNDVLTEISLPLLSTVGDKNSIANNAVLTEISLPLLSTVGDKNVIQNNAALTNITISSTGFTAIGDYYFNNNALSEETVDNILIAFDNSGIENKTIFLDGGTNSVPSAAGLTAKSNLEGKGWTVNVNS